MQRLLPVFLFFSSIFFYGCIKEPLKAPFISFSNQKDYLSKSSSLFYGDSIRFLVKIECEGDNNWLNSVKVIKDSITLVDTILFDKTKVMFSVFDSKDLSDTSVYVFYATNIEGLFTRTKIDIVLLNGEIKSSGPLAISSIGTPLHGRFFSTETLETIHQDTALDYSALIDVVAYKNISSDFFLCSTGFFKDSKLDNALMSKLTVYNGCVFFRTDFDTTFFNQVKNDRSIISTFLENLGNENQNIKIEPNAVIGLFSGKMKKGLIKIDSISSDIVYFNYLRQK